MGADRGRGAEGSFTTVGALDIPDLNAIAPSTEPATPGSSAVERADRSPATAPAAGLEREAEWVEDDGVVRVTRLAYGLHLTVLLVSADDVEPFRQAAEESVLDVRIETVPTSEATVARLERSGGGSLRRRPLPDAIVVALPIQEAHHLLEQIQGDDRFGEVPTIVLTDVSSPELERRSFKLGAAAHLPVPRRDYERVALVHALPDFMPRARAVHAQLESHRR